MSLPNQLNAINPAIARIADNTCLAFTKTGNPCRNRKKIGGDYCGKHDSALPEAKRQESSSARSERKDSEQKSDRKESDRKELEEAIARSDRCTKITKRGVQCKHFVNNGGNGLCKRHLRAEGALAHLNGVLAQQAQARALWVARAQPLPRAEAVRPQPRDIMDEDEEIDEISRILDQTAFEQEVLPIRPSVVYVNSLLGGHVPVRRSPARAGAGAMGYKTNMKTLRECECDICAEDKKRMIMLHCCRKEMCADCMGKITNAKCPFCKQDNTMLID